MVERHANKAQRHKTKKSNSKHEKEQIQKKRKRSNLNKTCVSKKYKVDVIIYYYARRAMFCSDVGHVQFEYYICTYI